MNRLVLLVLLAALPAAAETLDFENGEINAEPPGWTITMTHGGGNPRWLVVDDDTAPAGSQVLGQLSAGRSSQRFPLAILNDASLANGSISVSFKPIAGRIDQAAGLVWRYQDENNYYVVRANALEDNVVLYKVQNGRRSSLSPVGRSGEYGMNHAVPGEQWSRLAVRFSGSSFVVSFEGQELYEVQDTTFTEPGQLGLWTKADSVTFFDKFEFSAID